jgi:hypothetical protein
MASDKDSRDGDGGVFVKDIIEPLHQLTTGFDLAIARRSIELTVPYDVILHASLAPFSAQAVRGSY